MIGRTRRRGFTLVELLVVIFIIGLVAALLLAAIQAAREAARRVQCMNQVKQLALAAITHHEQVGHYPTNGWNEPGNVPPSGHVWARNLVVWPATRRAPG